MNWNDQSALVRGVRPTIGWLGVLFIVLCVVFITASAGIVLYAMFRWAEGAPLDWQGFAALLIASTTAGTAVWSALKQYLLTRYGQRVEEIRAGSAPPPLPTTPPPSYQDGGGQPYDGGVNPHGGPGAP